MGAVRRKTVHWVHRSPTLADLPAIRDEIVTDPGTDVEHGEICEERENLCHLDDDPLLAAHVDLTIAELQALFADGIATLHRAISVDDVASFVATVASAPLGSHWTTDRERATTTLHSGEMRWHDVLLSATVRAEDVCWATTMQQRICHPSEVEVFVTGRVRLERVMDMATGETATMDIDCES